MSAVSLLTPIPGRAQILHTPDGTVEFIGLHHWTPEQIRDTLAVVRPDVPLTSGACAAVLRVDVGFPAAAVNRFSFGDGSFEDHVLITVVEPESRDRVRFRRMPADSLPPRSRWATGYDLIESKGWAWGAAVQYRTRTPPPRFWERFGDMDTTDFHAARAFLESHSTEEDLALALAVLEQDRNWMSRAVALAVLGGFPDRPEAWYGLIRAARGYGQEDWSRDHAAMMIESLRRQAPDSIDWTPVSDDLGALLDGTTLFAFMPVLELLADSGLSPELTRELLAGGAPLVIDHVEAHSPMPRQAARRFLERVSGEEHGDDGEAWSAWIASLALDPHPRTGIEGRTHDLVGGLVGGTLLGVLANEAACGFYDVECGILWPVLLAGFAVGGILGAGIASGL